MVPVFFLIGQFSPHVINLANLVPVFVFVNKFDPFRQNYAKMIKTHTTSTSNGLDSCRKKKGS